jgi:hypothetical protein
MATIKWKSGTKPAPEEPKKGITQDHPILPLAEKLAKEIEAELLLVFANSAKPGTVSVVASPGDAGGLMVIDLPEDAMSLDDVPDEADHYVSGLRLMEALDEEGAGIESKGRDVLLRTLSGFDRTESLKLATGWIKMHLEAGHDLK